MRVLGIAGALALLVAGAAAGHARAPAGRPQTLQVAGRVSDLSADGARVAFHVGTGRCQTVRMWKPGLGLASMRPDCGHDVLMQNLTLAGTRALWVDYDTGNHLYCLLMTATLARPKPSELPECDPTDQDRELHGLAGDGPLLVFNSWYDCNAPGVVCSPGRTVNDVELWRVLAGALKKIGSWRNVGSVDSGRILIVNPLTLLDANGRQIWSETFHGHEPVKAKLSGSEVLVEPSRLSARNRVNLLLYAAKNGAYAGVSRFLPPKASLRDFQDGIAVYLLGGVVHVLRMSDGLDRVFRAPGGRPVLDAELEQPGLFYSYNVRHGAKKGRIAFVRFAELTR